MTAPRLADVLIDPAERALEPQPFERRWLVWLGFVAEVALLLLGGAGIMALVYAVTLIAGRIW